MRASIFIILFSVLISAQTTPKLDFRGNRPGHATVAAAPTALAVKPGAKIALFIDVTPNPKIHVYAPGAKDYIPITVKLDPQAAIKPGKLSYPKSETMTFVDEKVPVFQKPFRLTQEATIADSAQAGTTLTLTGKVDYQACDDVVCFPPESANVAWTIAVK